MKLGLYSSFVLGAAVLPGCGYRAAFGGRDSALHFTVASAPLSIPHPEVLQAALAGARAELSRDDALAAGSAFPRLVIEVLRVDEVASGIAATPTAGSALPLGRGSTIGVTARAWIEERAGAAPERETGDVRRVDTVAQDGDSVVGGVAVEQAAWAAGRRVGEALAKRALGIVEPAVEPM